MADTIYKCRCDAFTAIVNNESWPMRGRDFAFLGIVTCRGQGPSIGWAWRLDGRSIDEYDNALDLLDFPQSAHLAETVGADG